MKLAKMILICFAPIPLLYLLNLLVFNEYPVFFACFLGSCTYIPSLTKINSCGKVINNLLDKRKKELSNEDLMNLLLVFILTWLFIISIYIMEKKVFVNTNNLELGHPFWGTAIIFQLMGYLKVPKKFFV